MKFKKGLAALCSALTLFSSGIPAGAQETLDPAERDDLSTSVINVIADQVYAAPGETVAYSVSLLNNTGYATLGLRIEYDSALQPEIVEGTYDTPTVQYGKNIPNGLKVEGLNLDLNYFAAGVGYNNNVSSKKNGVWVTTWFTVPKTSQIGDTFPMKLKVIDCWGESGENVEFVSLDGWIKVNTEATTTTETTTTTSTTETTTTTSTTETTTSTTTTETTTTTSTIETTTFTSTTETTTSTTTTEPTTLTMGDIDGNGAVELDDAQLALAAYTNQLAHKPSGLNAEQEKAADVTGDGEVTVDDAQAILQYYTETLAHKDPTWDKILHPDQT